MDREGGVMNYTSSFVIAMAMLEYMGIAAISRYLFLFFRDAVVLCYLRGED